MPENEPLHWTEDDDLLSEYVLGRLDPDQTRRLETHLQTCLPCRENVQRERAVAAGVRLHGRTQLKEKLRASVADKPGTLRLVLTWQRVISAAAVLVIFAGLGIYYRWIAPGPFHPPVAEEDKQRTAAKANPAEERRAEDKDLVAGRQSAAPQSQHGKAGLTEGGKNRAKDAERPSQEVARSAGTNAGYEGQSADNLAKASGKSEAVSRKEKSLETVSKPEKALGEQAYWSQGVFLPSIQSEGGRASAAGKFAQGAEPSVQEKKRTGETPDINAVRAANQQQALEISQFRTDLLPEARQRVFSQTSNQVQTRFQQTGGQVDITLFLDTLFSKRDLQNARVERISADSVIIEIRGRRIGYKLPEKIINSVLDQRTH